MMIEESRATIAFHEEERCAFEEAAAYLQEFMNFLEKRPETVIKIDDLIFYHNDFNDFIEALKMLGKGKFLDIE